MDFINRGFSSLLTIALVVIAIYFLINILPVALVIGAGVWGISYVVKKFRNLIKSKRNNFNNRYDDIEIKSSQSFSSNDVIDVEYTEI